MIYTDLLCYISIPYTIYNYICIAYICIKWCTIIMMVQKKWTLNMKLVKFICSYFHKTLQFCICIWYKPICIWFTCLRNAFYCYVSYHLIPFNNFDNDNVYNIHWSLFTFICHGGKTSIFRDVTIIGLWTP